MSADLMIVCVTAVCTLAFMVWAVLRGRHRRRMWLGTTPPPEWWRRRERDIARTRR